MFITSQCVGELKYCQFHIGTGRYNVWLCTESLSIQILFWYVNNYPYSRIIKCLQLSLPLSNNETRSFILVSDPPNIVQIFCVGCDFRWPFRVVLCRFTLHTSIGPRNVPGLPSLSPELCPLCVTRRCMGFTQVGTVWASNLNSHLVSAAVFGKSIFQESFQKWAEDIKRWKIHAFPQQFVPEAFHLHCLSRFYLAFVQTHLLALLSAYAFLFLN